MNFSKVCVKVSWSFDYLLSRYLSFSDGTFDVFRTIDKIKFRKLIKRCFLISKNTLCDLINCLKIVAKHLLHRKQHIYISDLVSLNVPVHEHRLYRVFETSECNDFTKKRQQIFSKLCKTTPYRKFIGDSWHLKNSSKISVYNTLRHHLCTRKLFS